MRCTHLVDIAPGPAITHFRPRNQTDQHYRTQILTSLFEKVRDCGRDGHHNLPLCPNAVGPHDAVPTFNAQPYPDWASVDRYILTIAGRAISSLIHSQGIGDLYKIYLNSQRDGIDYNLAYIGKDFAAEHKVEFDTKYMRELFEYAYQRARVGYQWKKHPPDYALDN